MTMKLVKLRVLAAILLICGAISSQAQVMKTAGIRSEADIQRAIASSSEEILLDAGAGDGRTFDWSFLAKVTRPYFLAGGLNPENVSGAVRTLNPYAVDVSSGIETDGFKDKEKMRAFVREIRGDRA